MSSASSSRLSALLILFTKDIIPFQEKDNCLSNRLVSCCFLCNLPYAIKIKESD
uniref:Uncharacterized protein n=1 Tax=Rhizophora mucronata TaxID=61149 RepID=A0A2P2PU13_RHIMU